MSEYQNELKEVLLTFDKEKITNFLIKNNKTIPQNEQVFWLGVHKGIVNLKNTTEDEKKFSKEYILSRGYKLEIF